LINIFDLRSWTILVFLSLQLNYNMPRYDFFGENKKIMRLDSIMLPGEI
jgi:hypothetical protein